MKKYTQEDIERLIKVAKHQQKGFDRASGATSQQLIEALEQLRCELYGMLNSAEVEEEIKLSNRLWDFKFGEEPLLDN